MKQLADYVTESAKYFPNHLAVKAPDGQMTYEELDKTANRIARMLKELGVEPNDRVAIWAEKSCKVVAVMQAILRLGAAYVPIDPQSPFLRARGLVKNCQVKAIVTSRTRAEELLTGEYESIPCLCIEGAWNGFGWDGLRVFSDEPLPRVARKENDLAYILYTSGSTGQPKGVCISQLNATAFVDWCRETTKAKSKDRFSNHAPFNFDLSVLDLYTAFSVGASVHIISEAQSYLPAQLVDFIRNEKITIWYSVPSALIMMKEYANFLNAKNLALHTIMFAGEPFPIKHLRPLRDQWPKMRLLNLYGPTETNVCSYFEVSEIHDKRTTPMPIGIAACNDSIWAVQANGSKVTVPGEEGELMVSGPTVFLGYWGQPPQGDRPYPTGDIVRLEDRGNYVYIGRKDHLVKIGGHRVELGEIEATLMELPDVREASVIVHGSGLEARLIAFLVWTGAPPPSLIEIKRHCSKRLPRYMIVDSIRVIDAPPLTNTGKIDKNVLKELVETDKSKIAS